MGRKKMTHQHRDAGRSAEKSKRDAEHDTKPLHHFIMPGGGRGGDFSGAQPDKESGVFESAFSKAASEGKWERRADISGNSSPAAATIKTADFLKKSAVF